jgi:hypothetical protein
MGPADPASGLPEALDGEPGGLADLDRKVVAVDINSVPLVVVRRERA